MVPTNEQKKYLKQGCEKLPFPPRVEDIIKLLGKKIKFGRREGKREEGKGNEK